MKIQIVKKADKKPLPHSGCSWVVDQLLTPGK
jgi:hypothetical protein